MTRKNGNVRVLESRKSKRQIRPSNQPAQSKRWWRWLARISGRIMPIRWWAGLLIVAAVMLLVAIKLPILPKAIAAGGEAFMATTLQGWFGDNPTTTDQVEQVLYGNLEPSQAVGVAIREIHLNNQTVEIENTDLAGWGSERLQGDATVIAIAEVTLQQMRVNSVESGFTIELQPASIQGLYFPVDAADGFPVLSQRSRNLVTRIGDMFGQVTPELVLYQAMAATAKPMAQQDYALLAEAEAAAAANIKQLLSHSGLVVDVTFADAG